VNLKKTMKRILTLADEGRLMRIVYHEDLHWTVVLTETAKEAARKLAESNEDDDVSPEPQEFEGLTLSLAVKEAYHSLD
jgi:hypothetical protein